jgi:hypothetical protein
VGFACYLESLNARLQVHFTACSLLIHGGSNAYLEAGKNYFHELIGYKSSLSFVQVGADEYSSTIDSAFRHSGERCPSTAGLEC